MPSDAARKPDKPVGPEAHADRPGDDVEVSSDASFPASDPPSWTPVSRVGSPDGARGGGGGAQDR